MSGVAARKAPDDPAASFAWANLAAQAKRVIAAEHGGETGKAVETRVIASIVVSALRALAIGTVHGIALIVALALFGGTEGWSQLLVLVPPCALGLLSLGTPRDGWWLRLARGVLGGSLAALVAIFIIARVPALFPFPADRGATLFVAVLCTIASIPGFTAAASTEAHVGRSLAVGFVTGLSVPLLLRGAVGVVLLLVSGALVGSVVAKLRVSSRNHDDGRSAW